jgi:putative hemolysin
VAFSCTVASEDERGSLGVPQPAAEYCQGLGYTALAERCQFPDGTDCEQWSFFRGQCGQKYSYCNLHGGQVTSETQDNGTWTAVVAVCEIDGKRCLEDRLWRSGECVSPDQDAGQ